MSELAAVVRCLLGLLNTPMAASDAAHTRRAGTFCSNYCFVFLYTVVSFGVVGVALRVGVGARADEPQQQQLVQVFFHLVKVYISFIYIEYAKNRKGFVRRFETTQCFRSTRLLCCLCRISNKFINLSFFSIFHVQNVLVGID